MEALVVSEFGDIDVLEFQEIADPTPAPNEVSIDVLYAAVNFADTRMRSGAYYSPIVPPFILGREVVGRVRELGHTAVDLVPGELVAARTTSGAYAPIATANVMHVVRLGDLDESTLEQVAAAPTAVATALLVLERFSRFSSGESLLVHGAAGGLGLVLSQIARRHSPSHVIGTVSDLAKADVAKQAGYTDILLRSEFHANIRGIVPRGVDVVVDPVGGSVRLHSIEALAPLGRLVTLGETSGDEQVAMTGPALRDNCVAFGGVSLTKYLALDPPAAGALLSRAIDAVASREVTFPELHVADLQEAWRAHEALESGRGVGKWILRVTRP